MLMDYVFEVVDEASLQEFDRQGCPRLNDLA